MIIVEGPDGAGKSTLIQALNQDTGIPVHERAVRDKSGPDERNLWEWTHRDMANWSDDLYLYDRYPLISEYIYGPVTRGQCAPGFTDSHSARALRRRVEEQCLMILCLPPFEVTWKNVAAEEQMEGVIANHRTIYALYATLRATWGGWYKVHDYTQNTYENVLLTVRMHAAQWRSGMTLRGA